MDHGKAVGAKDLKDYLEVRGYGDAARWVYAQASGGGTYRTSTLLTITEVREVHQRVMDAAWSVAPHPDAGSDEGPGSFRRHDIRPFGGGMTPTPWTDVQSQLTSWVDDVDSVRQCHVHR